jgi:hypothetical protein
MVNPDHPKIFSRCNVPETLVPAKIAYSSVLGDVAIFFRLGAIFRALGHKSDTKA